MDFAIHHDISTPFPFVVILMPLFCHFEEAALRKTPFLLKLWCSLASYYSPLILKPCTLSFTCHHYPLILKPCCFFILILSLSQVTSLFSSYPEAMLLLCSSLILATEGSKIMIGIVEEKLLNFGFLSKWNGLTFSSVTTRK